jgi:hypothetical protein
VESGSLGCELVDHLKTARLLKHHGKRRCRKGFEERQGKVKITHVLAELFLMLDGGVVRSATLDRGINENTNGLLRDWLSKGKSLDDATGAEVQKAYDSFNRRPQASGLEVPLEGLPPQDTALALRIRHGNGRENRYHPRKRGLKRAFRYHTYIMEWKKPANLAIDWFHILWSGERDSNPQQLAWKAKALPIELSPHSWSG